jgi:hypothetical protein
VSTRLVLQESADVESVCLCLVALDSGRMLLSEEGMSGAEYCFDRAEEVGAYVDRECIMRKGLVMGSGRRKGIVVRLC